MIIKNKLQFTPNQLYEIWKIRRNFRSWWKGSRDRHDSQFFHLSIIILIQSRWGRFFLIVPSALWALVQTTPAASIVRSDNLSSMRNFPAIVFSVDGVLWRRGSKIQLRWSRCVADSKNNYYLWDMTGWAFRGAPSSAI